MKPGTVAIDFARHPRFRLRGPARRIPAPLESHPSKAFQLVAMNSRLESRLRAALMELEEVRRLLDEADAALAEAGVPYERGNIRERISAYQVFKHGRLTNY